MTNFTLLTSNQISAATAAFPGRRQQLALASIIAGHTVGQMWRLDQDDAPAFYFLWDKGNNVFYLAGERLTAAGQAATTAFIQREIVPRALAQRLTYFKAQALPPLAADLPQLLFPGSSLQLMYSALYIFADRQPAAVPPVSLPDLQFVPVDRALLSLTELGNVEHVRAEISWMWPSLDHFYAHGLGWAALTADRLICWCTAEYMSADRCGIGIATHPAFRQKGVATATAVHFVNSCLAKGLQPHWECDRDNLPSVRVAEKAGFSHIVDEQFWAGQFER